MVYNRKSANRLGLTQNSKSQSSNCPGVHTNKAGKEVLDDTTSKIQFFKTIDNPRQNNKLVENQICFHKKQPSFSSENFNIKQTLNLTNFSINKSNQVLNSQATMHTSSMFQQMSFLKYFWHSFKTVMMDKKLAKTTSSSLSFAPGSSSSLSEFSTNYTSGVGYNFVERDQETMDG